MVRVELPELRVDDALLVGRGQQAGEPDQRLLGDLPVVLREAEVGEGGERLCVVGALGERGFEGLAGADDVAGLEEHAPAPDLDGEALLGVGHAIHAALEQLRQLGLHLPGGVDAREPIEHVVVRDVDRRGRLERRERPVFVLGVAVLPDPPCVVPCGELPIEDDAAARERFARLRGSAGVVRRQARLNEKLPRDDVPRVLDARALEQRPRLLDVARARRGFGRPHEQGRDLEGPRRALHEALGGGQRAQVVAPRAAVGLEHPQRPERRLVVRRGDLDHLARRIPAPGGAADAQARGELGVGGALRGPPTAQRHRDGARDRLDLLVAALADEVLLEVAQARLVVGLLLEDGSVPEERAPRVLADEKVEVREALERLPTKARVLRVLGFRKQVIGQARHAPRPQLGALARDPTERSVSVGGRLGAPEGAVFVACALVLARGFEQEQDAGVPGRLGGAALAPRRALFRRLGRHPLEVLAEGDVAGTPEMGFAQALGRERGVAVGDEQRLAHPVERRVDGIGGVAPSIPDPPQHLVDVSRPTRDALGKESRDRQPGRRLVRAVEQVRLRGLGQDALAERDRLEPGDGAADPVAQLVGERVHLGDQVDLFQGGDRAERDLRGAVRGTHGLVALEGAGTIASALGDDGGGERADRLIFRGASSGSPGLQRRAHVRHASRPRRHLQRDGSRRGGARRAQGAEGGFDGLRRHGRAEQAPERHQGPRLGGPGPELRARLRERAPIGVADRRHREGRGRAHERIEAAARGGGAQVLVGRRLQAEERRQDEAFGREQGSRSLQGLPHQGDVGELESARGERPGGLLFAPVDELAQPGGGAAPTVAAGRAQRGGQPQGASRQLGHDRELGDERGGGRQVPGVEGPPRAHQDLVRRRVGARGLSRPPEPQASAQRFGDRRELLGVGEAKPRGGRGVSLGEGPCGASRGDASVRRCHAGGLLEPLRRVLVVAVGRGGFGREEHRVHARRARRGHLDLGIERFAQQVRVGGRRHQPPDLAVGHGDGWRQVARLRREHLGPVAVSQRRKDLAAHEQRPPTGHAIGQRSRFFLEPGRPFAQGGARCVVQPLAGGSFVLPGPVRGDVAKTGRLFPVRGDRRHGRGHGAGALGRRSLRQRGQELGPAPDHRVVVGIVLPLGRHEDRGGLRRVRRPAFVARSLDRRLVDEIGDLALGRDRELLRARLRERVEPLAVADLRGLLDARRAPQGSDPGALGSGRRALGAGDDSSWRSPRARVALLLLDSSWGAPPSRRSSREKNCPSPPPRAAVGLGGAAGLGRAPAAGAGPSRRRSSRGIALITVAPSSSSSSSTSDTTGRGACGAPFGSGAGRRVGDRADGIPSGPRARPACP